MRWSAEDRMWFLSSMAPFTLFVSSHQPAQRSILLTYNKNWELIFFSMWNCKLTALWWKLGGITFVCVENHSKVIVLQTHCALMKTCGGMTVRKRWTLQHVGYYCKTNLSVLSVEFIFPMWLIHHGWRRWTLQHVSYICTNKQSQHAFI